MESARLGLRGPPGKEMERFVTEQLTNGDDYSKSNINFNCTLNQNRRSCIYFTSAYQADLAFEVYCQQMHNFS
jgi:hypothetical protein